MIRWGVISTAKIAKTQVIPAIQASNNGKIVAVGSRSADSARQFAEELGIPKHYGSYEDLIADPEIDAIYNPLPNDGHAPWSIAALKAGKHVLCEKPLALNAMQVEEMMAVAKDSGKLLMEAFMWRYHPQHARVRALIDEGAIGLPNLIHAEFTYAMSWEEQKNVRLKPELGGGGLLDVGCYCVNAARLISGQEPDQVSGFQTLGESGVDESFVGILHFPSGLLAHFDCGMRSYSRNRYTVVGDKGKISVGLAFRPDASAPIIELSQSESGIDRTERIVVPVANQYTLMAEDFADAIMAGRRPRYPMEDALRNMKVLDALLLSAHEARTVKL